MSHGLFLHCINHACPPPCLGIVPLATWRGITLLRIRFNDGFFDTYWLGRTDGTPAGTFLPLWTAEEGFQSPKPLVCDGCLSVDEPPYSPAPGVWLFLGFDDDGIALWSTDGTRPGPCL